MALVLPCFLLLLFPSSGLSLSVEQIKLEHMFFLERDQGLVWLWVSSSSSLSLLCCYFCLFSLVATFLCSSVVALTHIKNALTDPNEVLSKWDADSADPCSWTMITCSPENRVIVLGAPSQNLSGTLAGAIRNLTNLQQVLLQNNNITGEIPVELGMLRKLQTLDLSNNGFSGTVPDSLGQLASLRYLRLNNNSLSGPLPASLSKIPQLSFLDVSYNNLSGPVPPLGAKTLNIVGNPLIRGIRSTGERSETAAPTTLAPSQQSSQRKSKAQRAALAVIASVGGASMLLLLFSFLLCWRRKQKHPSILGISGGQHTPTNPIKAPYTTKYTATRTTPIKGYSATADERLLVNPFMSNDCVTSHLRGDQEGAPGEGAGGRSGT